MARAIERQDINATARPKLAAVIDKAMVYLLNGTPKRGRADVEQLTVWAEYGSSGAAEIIIDSPAACDEPEYFRAVRLDPAAVDVLTDHLTPLPVLPRGGRPVKYGREALADAQRMRGEGMSIRAIAAAMGCSPNTVQKLLK